MHGKSIRFRLTETDIASFAANHVVGEAIEFGGAQPAFCYELRTGTRDEANYSEGSLTVSLGREHAMQWLNSEEIGLEFYQPIDGDRSLKILIEKELGCSGHRSDDRAADSSSS